MYLRVLYISFAAFDCVDLPVNGLVSILLFCYQPQTVLFSHMQSWYIDGNVKCFSDHGHILLFIVGIVVSFLMTLPMLFIGLLPFSGLTEVRNDSSSSSSLALCFSAICYSKIPNYISKLWVQNEVQMVGIGRVGKKILPGIFLVCKPFCQISE